MFIQIIKKIRLIPRQVGMEFSPSIKSNDQNTIILKKIIRLKDIKKEEIDKINKKYRILSNINQVPSSEYIFENFSLQKNDLIKKINVLFLLELVRHNSKFSFKKTNFL